jgi:phosphatidylserine/phosphatidylglycerophosphate/cardiolipin synthase-like enzyme
VRILTNNYDTADCTGLISPLPFLSLNNIPVRYYSSTTFYHAKYMSRDGKAASVSSINYSKTSFTVNREAGVLLEGNADVVKFLTSVFTTDWENGVPIKVNQTYSSADMKVITDTAKRSITMPTIRPGMAPTPTPAAISVTGGVKVYTSPDSAHSTLMSQLTAATTSLDVEIYQVTDDTLCDFLGNASSKNGIKLQLLVSKYIYGPEDHTLATKCYTKLHAAGVAVRMTQDISFYQYCHQKFWIVDGKTVGLSTGNWSPSDYPEGGDTFIPYTKNGGWRVANRDYTVEMTSPEVVKTFSDVLSTDYQAGSDFNPAHNRPVMLQQGMRPN